MTLVTDPWFYAAALYNLLWGDDLHDLAGDVSMAGCGVLARSPLGYGLLAGRWGESHTFAPVDHRSKRWSRASLRQRVRQTEMMLVLAAVLEAFWSSSLAIPAAVKFGVGGALWVAVGLYFALGGRRRAA